MANHLKHLRDDYFDAGAELLDVAITGDTFGAPPASGTAAVDMTGD